VRGEFHLKKKTLGNAKQQERNVGQAWYKGLAKSAAQWGRRGCERERLEERRKAMKGLHGGGGGGGLRGPHMGGQGKRRPDISAKND